MKSFILLILVCLISSSAKADQLGYISKDQAIQAVQEIEKMKVVYLYCGCCDDEVGSLVRVLKVEARKANYKKFYQVYITFQTDKSEIITKGVDLAYVWTKKKRKVQTIGTLLSLKHDFCQIPKKVKWRKRRF